MTPRLTDRIFAVMSAQQALSGLRSVGPARPVAPPLLDAVERREGFALPDGCRRRLEAWGARGRLCGFAYWFDPTTSDAAADWQFYRHYLLKGARETRRAHASWPAVDEETWARLVVWASLDGRRLAWDTRQAERHGEYPHLVS